MRFRSTATTASAVILLAASSFAAHAETAPADGQWRASPLALSTLLQDGYKIVAVINGAHGSAGMADTIFVQRDQSAFKCIDPSPPDAKTKAACFELVQPSGAASEAK
ncbi:hypothetical protein [Paraburkholderia lacunae]|uniref:Uncharacterized protein n=1 Tax=Paraburkholderia lacunae TaxID=2211104 RepID=A0A370NGD6_9BURK|nr:hypothetical protein [Paraburkholderia lacunae]RDK04650.1 hypothetical protein DLM46_01945 [Paraburkholderia lacunae]